MILYGRKVVLRAIEEKDLEFLRNLTNDPEVERMIEGFAYPVSERQEKEWYCKHIQQTEVIRWMIETKQNETVGIVSMGNIDWKNRVAHTMSIKLDTKRIKESGIAIDAMEVVIKYAFEELNLNRIEGGYLDYNKQSMALNKMVGFKKEGLLRQAVYKEGHYHDFVVTAIIKDDYLSRRLNKGKRYVE